MVASKKGNQEVHDCSTKTRRDGRERHRAEDEQTVK